MEISYRVNGSLDEAELQKLYRQAPWARERSLEGIAAMMQHTPVHVSAWLGESMVGFARALTALVETEEAVYHNVNKQLALERFARAL